MWIHHTFIYMMLSDLWLRYNWFQNYIDWKDVELRTLSLSLTLILTWYELFEWVLYFIWKHPFPWSHKSLLWSTFLCTNFFLPNWKFVTLFVICRCLLILLESSRENQKSEIKLHCIPTFFANFLTQADILHASLIYSRRFLIYTSPYTFILVFLVIYFHKYFFISNGIFVILLWFHFAVVNFGM